MDSARRDETHAHSLEFLLASLFAPHLATMLSGILASTSSHCKSVAAHRQGPQRLIRSSIADQHRIFGWMLVLVRAMVTRLALTLIVSLLNGTGKKYESFAIKQSIAPARQCLSCCRYLKSNNRFISSLDKRLKKHSESLIRSCAMFHCNSTYLKEGLGLRCCFLLAHRIAATWNIHSCRI